MRKTIVKHHNKNVNLKEINESYKLAISIASVGGVTPAKEDLKIFKQYVCGKISYSKYMNIIENKYRKN